MFSTRPKAFLRELALSAAALLLATRPARAAAPLDAERRTPVVRAVEQASPAVVNISTEQVVVLRSDPFFDQFFSEFFDARPRQRSYKQTSLGSGVLIRDDGYVVTNAHVVARGAKIRVTLVDEREFDAKIVGADEESDLAVLKISGDHLPHIEFGRSDDLMIGETVIAIGNPFGFSHTVTTGVVSAVGRSLKTEGRTYLDFVQTDASINPGNSGGPLLNIRGELIAINTAIYGGAQNIGFAIPASKAARVTADLIRFGGVRRGDLGLLVQDLTPELANALDAGGKHGVVVREVESGSPAASAGVQSGDILVSIDGHELKDREEFEARVGALNADDGVRLGLIRRGEPLTVTATAGTLTERKMEDRGWRQLGLRVRAGRDGQGLAISDVRGGSPAARAGIRPGDLLLAIAGSEVDSVETYRQALRNLHAGERTEIVVQRGRSQYRIGLPVDD